ncbi:MAG: DUF523 domain-containing protein [Bacilli bacterium]
MKLDNNKPCILVSACLLGSPTRYDGKSSKDNLALQLIEFFNVIPICPESDSGMTTPREPSEIRGNKVFSSKGKDVTSFFVKGAEMALEQAKKYNVKLAVLKEKSPSCGFRSIYDGSFSGKLIKGKGITTKMLLSNNIQVIPDTSLPEFIKSLRKKDN